MVNFVIAGLPTCTAFVHAVFIGRYLEKNLPNITLGVVQLEGDDWRDYVKELKSNYGWNNLSCPVIYKELIHFGGTPFLIGGLSTFWEYCYDYYNLETLLPPGDLEALVNDNLEEFNKSSGSKGGDNQFTILMYGASSNILAILIPQLLEIPGLSRHGGIRVLVYDDKLADTDILEYDDLISHLSDYNNLDVQGVGTLNAALRKCDLLLFLEDVNEHLSDANGIKSLKIKLIFLCEQLDLAAKPDLKIVVANSGCSVFIGNCIIRGSTFNPNNVVVVTSDVGLNYLNVLAKENNITLDELCAPPVWGMVGTYEFVDLPHTLKKCNVYKPYERSIRCPTDTSLEQGTVSTEFRFINYLIDDTVDYGVMVEHNKQMLRTEFNRSGVYSKVRAISSLLTRWYGSKESEDVISLGIICDGSFDLPSDLIFSQPATLKDGIWVPFAEYPIEPETQVMVSEIADMSIRYIKEVSSVSIIKLSPL